MKLEFQSQLNDSAATLWNWIISRRGINNELSPLMYMTSLDALATITEDNFTSGKVIADSWILLFGFLPIDRLRITPVEVVEGAYFIEESPMFTMKRWRHERYVIPRENKCEVKDVLTFEPYFFSPFVTFFIKMLFKNRHRKLRKRFS
ncbi:hypothetical protein [Candidatus Uabimicrobium amorphum]|uniref:Uncharacterized protein n=1 Tax=Uabimicrobium amorphum TaxID=2596890 RepID=A0A5S9ILS4_UABAM|nr:hypothetical protein [Candidatus Uabimicrobium amorphum]BBM83390.1 hypothetical protein UABAM_01742 [Candidatus Uabimicrobium amorphum]